MSSNGLRMKSGRASVVVASSLVPLSLFLLSMASCAGTESEAPAAEDGGHPIPGEAGGDAFVDGSALDSASLPCAVGNLCSVSTPLSVGSVAALSGRSKNDVWASGSRGLLMHWTGQAWTKLESDNRETLTSLFLTPDEMWGVAGNMVVRRGEGASSVRQLRFHDLFRWRGMTGVAVLPSGEAYVGLTSGYDTPYECLAKVQDFDAGVLEFEADPVLLGTAESRPIIARALFLVPDRALWLVGEHGAVARYPVSPLGAGVEIPVPSQATLLAAWGVDTQLWAAGNDGTILHFDGSNWRTEATGTKVTLNAIFGLSPNDIWAVGDQGTVLHFDGSQWSRVDLGSYRGKLEAVWGASSDDVWIGGENAMFHWGALP